ncbi:MAG: UDP-N-acetylmuramoyl-tripeptide--D-alanyl-D-alanine ligase, partial [Sedimentibacter sp.]
MWNKDEPNPPENIAVILVDDTVIALQELALAYRNMLSVKIVGITGSNGKTSTKDITAGILSQRYKTQKTMGNYNTEIGVPYTLLSLDEDCEVAVIEMGMEKKGEINFLTRLVQPDIGIITSVGLVHIDNFNSIEEIAKAKLEIVNGIKGNGLFIYFGDDELIEKTVKNTEIKKSILKETFGLREHNNLWLKEFNEDIDGITFKVNDEKFQELYIEMLGKHQALNAMAAILAAKYLGMSNEEIRLGLLKIEKTGLRNEVVKINECTILNDCYKSNPVSISAALEIFELFESKKKIAILGDMLGYREMSHDTHYKVGKDLGNHNIDELVTIGQEARFMAKGARENTNIKSIVEFDTKEEATEYLSKYLEENCTMLIKGSRFLKLEYIANKLKDGRKMNKTKLAILFGGKSDEYSVSLHSAAAIIRNVPIEAFEVTLIGITRDGKWLHFEGSADKVNDDTWHKEKLSPVLLSMDNNFKGLIELDEENKTFKKIEIDCIFPVLHGRNGEDGTIQGLCQMTGIPFVGCDMTSSAVSMDKEFTHAICEMAGINMAPYIAVVNNKTLNLKKLYDEAFEKLSVPMFIKPANNGSSLGISKVRNYDEFEKGMMEAFDYDKKVIIESMIPGFEIECA